MTMRRLWCLLWWKRGRNVCREELWHPRVRSTRRHAGEDGVTSERSRRLPVTTMPVSTRAGHRFTVIGQPHAQPPCSTCARWTQINADRMGDGRVAGITPGGVVGRVPSCLRLVCTSRTAPFEVGGHDASTIRSMTAPYETQCVIHRDHRFPERGSPPDTMVRGLLPPSGRWSATRQGGQACDGENMPGPSWRTRNRPPFS